MGGLANTLVSVVNKTLLYYSVGLLFGAISGVFAFDASSRPLASGPLDCATTCVGAMYSNFRESRVNVTGPSLVRLTFIMAPNLPSLIFSGEYCVPKYCRNEAYRERD